LGAHVHICGGLRLHGDADVPRVCALVLCGWPETDHADLPLGGKFLHVHVQKPCVRRDGVGYC